MQNMFNYINNERGALKMKKLSWFILLFCLLILTSFAASGQDQAGKPKIFFPKESWDFGKVAPGTLQHTFAIKNLGDAELTVYAYPSCRVCISPELSRNNIPPKGRAKLFVKLYANYSGEHEAYAMIQSNDPDQPVIKIVVKAFVVSGEKK